MDNTKATLELVESVLGKGAVTGKGNYIFVCPFHISNPPGKKKLEMNMETDEKGENPYHCWACGAKGKTVKTLFKKMGVLESKKKEMKFLIKPGAKREKYNYKEIAKLPDEFIPLTRNDLKGLDLVFSRHALNYLEKRNINQDIIRKYNIGFCREGRYDKRIIIPSYDSKGRLNYFQARSWDEDINPSKRYLNDPNLNKDIIGFELYINWEQPVMLCEGIFDAITIKRNVIPLFGKSIEPKLKEKLINSNVKKIYISLDDDAIKDALKFAEEFISFGKEVYLINLKDKDASKIGFEKFLEILEQTQPLTFSDILKIKLKLI